MRKVILITLLLSSVRVFAQTIPPNLSQVNTMTWYRQTTTGDMFAYRGLTLGYYHFLDSTKIAQMISSGSVPVTASNGLTKVGNDIRDGGTLTANTTKNLNDFSWNLSAYKSDFTAFSEMQFNAGQAYFIASSGVNRNASMFVQGNSTNTARAFIGTMKRISSVNKYKALDITYEGIGLPVVDDVDNIGLINSKDNTVAQLANDRAITDVGGIKSLISTYAPNLSLYVPYTGATTDLNLGTHDLLGRTITAGTNNLNVGVYVSNSSGSGNLEPQAVTVTNPSGNYAQYRASYWFLKDLVSGYNTNFYPTQTGIVGGADISIFAPNHGGILALISDIPGGGAGGTVVNSFNSRTGAVTPQSSDYSTFYALKDTALNINKNLYDLSSKSTSRTNLGVYSKTEVDAIALLKQNAFTLSNNQIPRWSGSNLIGDTTNTWNGTTFTIGSATGVVNRGRHIFLRNDQNTGTVASNSAAVLMSKNRYVNFEGRSGLAAGIISFQAADTTGTLFGQIAMNKIGDTGIPSMGFRVGANTPLFIRSDSSMTFLGVETHSKTFIPAIGSIPYAHLISIISQGNSVSRTGAAALVIDAQDASIVTSDPTKRGVLYGLNVGVTLLASRNNAPNEDAVPYTSRNNSASPFNGTEAFYVAHNPVFTGGAKEFNAAIGIDGNADNAFKAIGTYNIGIDFGNPSALATLSSGILLRSPNNISLATQNAANSANIAMIKVDASNIMQLYNSAVGVSSAGVITDAGAILTPTTGVNSLVLHNQSDQTTNFEKLTYGFASNLAVIGTSAGGTGTVRELDIQAGTAQIKLNQSGVPRIDFTTAATSGGTMLYRNIGAVTSSSVRQVLTTDSVTSTQTLTGGVTAHRFAINNSGRSGTGTDYFWTAGKNATTNASLDVNGKLSISVLQSAKISEATTANTPTGAVTDSVVTKNAATLKLGAVPVSQFLLANAIRTTNKLFGTGSGTAFAEISLGTGLSFTGSTLNISGTAIAGSFSQVGTATTTFTVTIGSAQPNNTYKVNVTPTDLLAAAAFYVTNKTTTTFDVVYLAGLTGAVTFDWSLFQ